jgi:hypothetical protein
MGACTTRNAPAQENGDEIVAGLIEVAHYFAQYCGFATERRAISNIMSIM